jgi:hypothetical protein
MKRKIPTSVWINIFFGGFANQFGWIFFGFGMVFFWIFAVNADTSFLLFFGERVTAQGIITDSRDTNVSINEKTIYENHYTFVDDRGKKVQDLSYSTGRWLKEGTLVTVEYPAEKPYYSRIREMRREMFASSSLFVLIFPLVGLTILIFNLKEALQRVKLLQYSVFTQGKFLSKEPTNRMINDQRVYKFTFGFKDRSGRKFEVSEKTHYNARVLQGDREAKLLYQEDNPDNAILLPDWLKLDKQNNIQPGSLTCSFCKLIVPLITLLGHGAYFFFAFLR